MEMQEHVSVSELGVAMSHLHKGHNYNLGVFVTLLYAES